MKNFALIGVGGYIAPRHLEAIYHTGNSLVAALDKNDSVGILDKYFPQTDFFTEFERFDRHLEKLKRQGKKIDYFSICSPNYLHDAHIRFALRYGADVICEKPLVLNPWNLSALSEMEKETGKRIYTILQLRLHPSVIALKHIVNNTPSEIYDVELTYITSRGKWYYTSWKGDVSKSGGIATNIGIHFFDMLSWVFGNVKKNEVHLHTFDRAAGFLQLDKANVKWFLSINENCLPEQYKRDGRTTYRSLLIGDEEFEFSGGFSDLHNKSYEQILEGQGFSVEENRISTQVVHEIRTQELNFSSEKKHPLTELPLELHPFNRGNWNAI